MSDTATETTVQPTFLDKLKTLVIDAEHEAAIAAVAVETEAKKLALAAEADVEAVIARARALITKI